MTPSKTIRLATRASKLALWQANHVAATLNKASCQTELVPMTTEGDRVQNRPLHEIGGKGLFIKELECALSEGRADIAVHSLKDLPVRLAPQFCLAAILPRHAPDDILVINPKSNALAPLQGKPITAEELGLCGAITIATGSLRRTSLLSHYAPQIIVTPVRGNVDTRLRKMEELGWDGLVLAQAGLERLDLLKGLIYRPLASDFFVPSPAQGAIAIEILDGSPVAAALTTLHCERSCAMVMAERWLLERLGGDCTVPIGCLIAPSPDARSIIGRAVYFDSDGRFFSAYREISSSGDLAATALKLAEALYEDLGCSSPQAKH